MIIRPYGSEKFDKPGFETFYESVKNDGVVKIQVSPPDSPRVVCQGMVCQGEVLNLGSGTSCGLL